VGEEGSREVPTELGEFPTVFRVQAVDLTAVFSTSIRAQDDGKFPHRSRAISSFWWEEEGSREVPTELGEFPTVFRVQAVNLTAVFSSSIRAQDDGKFPHRSRVILSFWWEEEGSREVPTKLGEFPTVFRVQAVDLTAVYSTSIQAQDDGKFPCRSRVISSFWWEEEGSREVPTELGEFPTVFRVQAADLTAVFSSSIRAQDDTSFPSYFEFLVGGGGK